MVFTLLILRAKRACKIASTVTKKFSLANVQNPLMIIIQYSWYGQSLPPYHQNYAARTHHQC